MRVSFSLASPLWMSYMPYYLAKPTIIPIYKKCATTLWTKVEERFWNVFEGAEKVVGWALSHHLMTNPGAELNSKLVLSIER